MAFLGVRIKIVYLLAPHYEILASLGLIRPGPTFSLLGTQCECRSTPHTSTLVTSMLSANLGSPLHPQAFLINFGKKYPSRPLGFQASAGHPQDPLLLSSLSDQCSAHCSSPYPTPLTLIF